MYRIRMKRGFATILKNEKEIEPLSGLLVVGGELKQLKELVSLANIGAAQQKLHPTPESLATSQAVINADNFSQSDGESTPAQARVS